MRLAVRVGEISEHPAAGFGAAPAGLRADATMLVVIRMFVTFCPTRGACPGARFHDRAHELRVGETAGEQTRRRPTEIGTVEVEPYTLLERGDVGLVETGVRAGETSKLAGDTRFDTVGA